MHRSGTSSFTRVLNLLGAQLPSDLLPADGGNERGYWEASAIVLFNDRLLAAAGSRWNDCLPIDPRWQQSPEYAAFLDEARELLRAEYEAAPVLALKDPRVCRLASFWLAAIEGMGIRPVIALPQRDPAEVSASLQARDALPHEAGLLLWLRHVLDAEHATRGRTRYFSDYQRLLTNWRQVVADFEAASGLDMPDRSAQVDAAIDAFLTPDLRHHHADTAEEHTDLSAWLQAARAIMLRWCDNGEDDADFAELDAIRTAFDAVVGSFEPIPEPKITPVEAPREPEEASLEQSDVPEASRPPVDSSDAADAPDQS